MFCKTHHAGVWWHLVSLHLFEFFLLCHFQWARSRMRRAWVRVGQDGLEFGEFEWLDQTHFICGSWFGKQSAFEEELDCSTFFFSSTWQIDVEVHTGQDCSALLLQSGLVHWESHHRAGQLREKWRWVSPVQCKMCSLERFLSGDVIDSCTRKLDQKMVTECFFGFSHNSRDRLADLVAEHLDHLHYLNDILCLNIEALNEVLTDHLLNRLLIPLYVYSLTKRRKFSALTVSLGYFLARIQIVFWCFGNNQLLVVSFAGQQTSRQFSSVFVLAVSGKGALQSVCTMLLLSRT